MNDKVIIHNLEIMACCGVNPDEKINKQRFIFTIEIGLDFTSNIVEDKLDNTISYSSVRKLITPFIENSSFDLIEKLSYEVGKLILLTFDNALSVRILLKKPDAPMKGKFDYVGVETLIQWHKVYLSLGSNIGDRNSYLDFAIKSLKNDDNIKDIIESNRFTTQPYGGVANEMFINSAVELKTLYEPYKLLDILQSIEKQAGRERSIRWGNRTLDLDILFYDNIVLNDKKLCVPHYDLENRLFVLEPLIELNPYIYHPILNKRVIDLFNVLNKK